MKRKWLVGWLLLVLLGAGAGGQAQEEGEKLLITEIYYDAAGRDDAGEWFEIANLGADAISLADYKIGDEEQMGHGEGMARFPDGATISPGQVLVIARSAAGFRALFGRNPDFEITDGDPAVPDMERSALWATGEIALANEGDELLLVGPDNVIRDALSYGDSDTFFTPPAPLSGTGRSLARVPAACDSDSSAEWQVRALPTPGAISLEGECAAPADPLAGLDLLAIGAIQGSGDVSPYLDEVVTFAGVVTGSYTDRNMQGITYHTLFVQELPDAGDGDPATSDGIAVFLGRRRPTVAPGERVLVNGRVTEFYGLTEIDDAGLGLTPLSGEGEVPALPVPVLLDLPLSPGEWEALEGMRVALPAARVVGPTHTACGFTVLPAGAPAARLLRERAEDPLPAVLPVLHTSDVSCEGFPQVKVGDLVSRLAGPLTYHFEQFKLVQQDPAAVRVAARPLPPLPTVPELAPGQLSLATFNLHDYLAEAAVAPAVKREKLAQTMALALHCPTVVGVQEVQSRALLRELAAALAEPCGFVYEIAHRESADVRGIDVALLADPTLATVEAVTLHQTCTTLATGIEDPAAGCPPGQDPLFSRPPLQVTLSLAGQPYTIFVNHFKSKRGGEAETAPRRLAQARYLDELVAGLLAEEEGTRVVVMGDFNDYALSPALLALTEGEGGLENVLLALPPAERYTYNFGGISQLLDGLLLSPAVVADVDHVEIVHANTDYPSGWALDPALPFHSSDHDIPYLVLAPSTPEATAVAATPEERPTLPPEPEATAPPPAPTLPSTVPAAPEPTPSLLLWLAGGGVVAFSVLLLFLGKRIRD